MSSSQKINVYAAGMAIFAMYFGAGNIIFPLALGQFALDKSPYAIAGLLVTGVVMPIVALLTMFLYEGKVGPFFARLGRIPGFSLACFSIALLGPLGCAPRCITLSYSTAATAFPGLSAMWFYVISCALIFLFVINKTRLLSIIGYVLSPAKILLLLSIIVVGFYNLTDVHALTSSLSETSLFTHGLKEGYNTLDVIASFFFAPVIMASLSQDSIVSKNGSLTPYIVKASMIGAGLLSLIYVGFCYLAYLYVPELGSVPSDKLLAAIAMHVLGSYGGVLVSLTVAVTCLTTAIVQIAAFATFMQKEALKDRVSYPLVALGSIIITFVITTLGFQGISAFLGPVLEMCYPVLILLTVYNLVHKLYFAPAPQVE